MSNSTLVSYIDTTHGKWSNRAEKISRITIHHAAGRTSLESLSSILQTERVCSWNYGISNDGKIGLYVDEKYRAWTSSSRSNDNKAVTIEVSNSVNSGPPWTVSDAAYKSLLDLCEDICRRNNITTLTYTGQLTGSNVTKHQWFAATGCPGDYLGSKFPEIVRITNARLRGDSSLVPNFNPDVIGNSAYDNAVVGDLLPTSAIVSAFEITPYLATLDSTTKDIDYEGFKDIGVVGCLIDVGYYYDAIHRPNNYLSPFMRKQATDCEKYNIPYGLLFTARARTPAEAREEVSYWSRFIRNYVPELGVWLKLELPRSVSTNDAIMNEYQKRLSELGLYKRIGIYAKKQDLGMITWKDHCSEWLLWWDSHLSTMDALHELLTPELFILKE